MTWIPAYCPDADDYVYIESTPATGMKACPNCGDNHKPLRPATDYFGNDLDYPALNSNLGGRF